MSPTQTKIVLLVLALLTVTLGSALVGIGASLLARRDGLSRSESVLVGARAFGGTLTVLTALGAVTIEVFK